MLDHVIDLFSLPIAGKSKKTGLCISRDLKVFVSKNGVLLILQKIYCQPSLFNMLISFDTSTKATAQYDRKWIKSEMCLCLLGIFVLILLKQALHAYTKRNYLYSRSDAYKPIFSNLQRFRSENQPERDKSSQPRSYSSTANRYRC